VLDSLSVHDSDNVDFAYLDTLSGSGRTHELALVGSGRRLVAYHEVPSARRKLVFTWQSGNAEKNISNCPFMPSLVGSPPGIG
jgi:hypothetical protein